jgi:hypothetical protein
MLFGLTNALQAKCEAIEKREAEKANGGKKTCRRNCIFKENECSIIFALNTDPIGRNSFSSKEIKC